jgi:negative regulator of genetic competence, sporulation and motility
MSCLVLEGWLTCGVCSVRVPVATAGLNLLVTKCQLKIEWQARSTAELKEEKEKTRKLEKEKEEEAAKVSLL